MSYNKSIGLKITSQPMSTKSAFNPASASTVVTIDQFTSNLMYSANYGTLAREGYIENYISNTCISRTAKAIAGLPFDIMINGDNAEDKTDRLSKSLVNLIESPNVDYDWEEFMIAISSHGPISGDMYIHPELEGVGGFPSGIEYFRPDRVSILNTQDSRVWQYQYNNGSTHKKFSRDEDGYFDLIHIKNFNPLSDTNGLSDVVVAGLAIDSHTEANKYNKQIVSNGAKPSGMISINDAENSGILTETQIKDLQDRIQQKLQSNNGGIMVMNANAKFESINFTNAEMDWLNGIKANAIGMCNKYDFPPHLLGLESTTFNNIDSAKLEFYTQSVIPKATKIYKSIGRFLSRKLGVKVEFKIRKRDILELAPLFKELSSEARENFKVGLIHQNEGREIIGFEETPLGDHVFVDQNNQPMQPFEG